MSIQLNVKTLTGDTIDINIDQTSTVYNLKSHIQEKEGIPPDQQRLIFSKTVLKDGFLISEEFQEKTFSCQCKCPEESDPSHYIVCEDSKWEEKTISILPGSTVYLILKLSGGADPITIAAGIGIGLAKKISGIIKIAKKGNHDKMEKLCQNKETLYSTLTISGRNIEGFHSGNRVVTENPTSYKINMLGCKLFPKYSLNAQNDGVFKSKDSTITYKGHFSENKFDDNTGEASLCIGDNMRYKGAFKSGNRHGIGDLYLYNEGKGKYEKEFSGEWKEDQPYKVVWNTDKNKC